MGRINDRRADLARAINAAQYPHHVNEPGSDALDEWYLADVVLDWLERSE